MKLLKRLINLGNVQKIKFSTQLFIKDITKLMTKKIKIMNIYSSELTNKVICPEVSEA